MLIVSTLALAVFSIGLLITAVALRSRSVATMNFMICLIFGPVYQPWATLALRPPPTELERLSWIAAVVWTFLFLGSMIALAYCIYITREKKSPSRTKRRKRRKHRSRSDEQAGTDLGDDKGEKYGDEDDEAASDEI